MSTQSFPLFGILAGSTAASWWQYARWVYLIARNMRITAPITSELAAMRTFLKAIWNPQTQAGTRSWLQSAFIKKSVTGNYSCNIDNEPEHVIVELLSVVGRDLDNIPITAAEKTLVDTLIAATTSRRYGTSARYGSVGGSTVAV